MIPQYRFNKTKQHTLANPGIIINKNKNKVKNGRDLSGKWWLGRFIVGIS